MELYCPVSPKELYKKVNIPDNTKLYAFSLVLGQTGYQYVLFPWYLEKTRSPVTLL